MSGSYNLFDFDDLTDWSESSPRTRAIDTLQIHHGTILSYSGLRSLMDPGGRTVSANGAMANDGRLGEVVRTFDRRAFTSATAFDNQCLTVEVCNTTLDPGWNISEACRIRLARLAVGMYRKGILGSLTRAHIIGHNEVPGTYATACPGPDMDLDHIVALAQQFYAAGDSGVAGGAAVPIVPKEDKVKTAHYEDRRGQSLDPGKTGYMMNAQSQNQNAAVGVGQHSFTVHVYADGTPGDELEVLLNWAAWKARPVVWSPHYVERLVIPPSGQLRASFEFKRYVGPDHSVVVQATARAGNKAPVKVSVLDVDTFMFLTA